LRQSRCKQVFNLIATENHPEKTDPLIVSLSEFLSLDFHSMCIEMKVKYEYLQNMFKHKPRYSEEVQQVFSYCQHSQNSMKAMKKMGFSIPSTETVNDHQIEYISNYSEDLTELASEYFNSPQITCLSIDATAINQESILNTKKKQLFGFEQEIICDDFSNFQDFAEKYCNNEYTFASNIATIHLQACDNWNNRNCFLLKAIPKSKYSSTDIDTWMTSIQSKLSAKGISPQFISGDFAAEHSSYFSKQFEKLKKTKKSKDSSLFHPVPCVELDLDQLKNILIPIPDCRHLHRNLINQLINPKNLLVVGRYCCCFNDIANICTKIDCDISLPNGFFDIRDKQNQDRADFLISVPLLENIKSKEESLGLFYILDSIRNIVDAIRNPKLSYFQRLRSVAYGGFFVALQYHFAIYQGDYGTDHTFTKQSIVAIMYLIFGLSLGACRINAEDLQIPFFPSQLQEYKTENFYSFTRGQIGSNRNLNCQTFLTAANNYTSMLVNGTGITSGKLSNEEMERFAQLPKNDHISNILLNEFGNACKRFKMMCDSEYECPTLNDLLLNIQVPGFDILVTKDISMPSLSIEKIQDFLEKENDVKAPQEDRDLRKFKRKHFKDHFDVNGTLIHKQKLVRHLTFNEKYSCDVSRSRRFDKTKQKKAILNPYFSQIYSQLTQDFIEEQSNTDLVVGDYILQLDSSGKRFVCQIRQIKRVRERKAKKMKEKEGWNGTDYLNTIKWEYCNKYNSKEKLEDYRFLLRTFELGERNSLVDVSKEFTQYYEEIEFFPQIVEVSNGILIP
jgi:hypothetical protein